MTKITLTMIALCFAALACNSNQGDSKAATTQEEVTNSQPPIVEEKNAPIPEPEKSVEGIPTLSQLMNWINSSDRTKFDESVRSLGYSFEKKQKEDGLTNYFYVRTIKKNDINYSSHIVYKDLQINGTVKIEFVTSTIDLIEYYKTGLSGNKFTVIDCNSPSEENLDNLTLSCYNNDTFSIKLYDERKNLGNGVSNQYTIIIYKK